MAKKNKAPAPIISVDMVSDIVCPWCWLGKVYFDEAVRKSGRKVEVIYRPYMLDADVPPEGTDYKRYMAAKFGGESSDKFKAMREHLEAAAPDAGIAFNFSKLTVRPNTLRAHRLLRWTQGQALGGDVKTALFKAYFQDLRDIGNVDVLSSIAGEAGMDADLVRELLDSDRDETAIQEEILFYRNLGVSGVPTFIYNGQFAVQGAQPVSAHVLAIKQAASLPAQE